MKKIYVVLPILLAIAIAAGFYLGSKQAFTPTFKKEKSESQEVYNAQMKLIDIMNIINNEYVDTIDKVKLVEGTIMQMLKSLDPHSVYLPYEFSNREEEQLRGNFAGVGVKFMIISDTLTVTNVIKGGPSYRAGVKNGDRIIEIDGENVTKETITNDDVMGKLKGPFDSQVKLKLKRGDDFVDANITRGIIPIYSVSASFMLQPTVGYIKLERFSETSYDEFVLAADKLLNQGMKHLVFDLRGNGGGYLDIARGIADEFLEKDKLIVFTKDKFGEKDRLMSTRRGLLKNTKLSILIDSESASASEIVAGAIQDNDRGTIYGRRSFGKGLVQKPIMLRDSSTVRITIARYYTPTGRCIQKPYTDNYQDYVMELYDRDKNGELFHLDSSMYVDSLRFLTPEGKAVYGGGGITPDVFIPYDTSGYTMLFRKIAYSRAFSEFTLHYLDKHRDELKKQTLNDFTRSFNLSDKTYKEFLVYVKQKEITYTANEVITSKNRIKQRLKEDIASGIWDDEGRIYVHSRNDNDIQKTLHR
jgi:carboxyl-terminal processing protease